MNIYVGNLSLATTEDDVRREFEAHGEVSSVTVIMDRYSGKSRGFGFVEMPAKEQALAAMAEISGRELDGQTVRVGEAKPRAESGNRAGGNTYRGVYR